MIKKIVATSLFAVSLNAHAFYSNENLKNICDLGDDDKQYSMICTMYIGGVLDGLRSFMFYTDDAECENWKVLSPNMLRSAWEASYSTLDKDDPAIGFLVPYVLTQGNCADE